MSDIEKEMEERLYEKCFHCHLFVEPNDHKVEGDDLARYVHLTRGDEFDERFEDHEPMPSGMKANLLTWRVFGPSGMRERFVNQQVPW